jgi:hypothetical protein
MAPSMSEYSIKQREKRKKKKKITKDIAESMASQFPLNDLKRLSVASQGVAVKDYGGHFQTLNTTHAKGGKLTIGLVYENDQKSIATGNSMCQDSKKHLSLLKLVESSLKFSTKIDHPTEFLRAQFLFGAQTKKHTDSFRGNWFSYIIAFDVGYKLTVLVFPNFRTSVVEVLGTNYIPLSYSSEKGFLALTFEPNQPIRRVILPPDSYKECKPVGDFNFVVVGVKANGTIQIAPLKYQYAKSPTAYVHLTQAQAFERMEEKKTKPYRLLKTFKEVGVWNQFVAWQHIHWLSSGDNVRRISVFFRPLREVPTATNFIFKEGKEDWEDRRNIK